MFDILTRPGPDLSPVERDEVKKVARVMLDKLKVAVVLDWRQRAQARAHVRLTIEDALDDGLPRAYTPELYQQKVAAVFEHVFGSYQGTGRARSRRLPSGPRRAGPPQPAWRVDADDRFFAGPEERPFPSL